MNRTYEVDKSYLLIDCGEIKNKAGSAYYFDLGASTWLSGLGGASQSWFYEVYRDCGIEFTNFYAWESGRTDPKLVFEEIPKELQVYYHWYNIPANTDPLSPTNPLNMIRKIVTKDDFVVLKIDIDDGDVELEFIRQLLKDPSLLSLIDDFYFEHHVNVQEMNPSWKTQNETQTLKDTYGLFSQFRQAGVMAHSWV